MYEETVKIAATLGRVYVVVLLRLFGEAGRNEGGQDGEGIIGGCLKNDHSRIMAFYALPHCCLSLSSLELLEVGPFSVSEPHKVGTLDLDKFIKSSSYTSPGTPLISCLRACLSLISSGGNATHRVTKE